MKEVDGYRQSIDTIFNSRHWDKLWLIKPTAHGDQRVVEAVGA
jgi:hypothetical protein